ncbi:MAG: ABC transporter permease subunit [Planctomycetota bacterium]|nr:ABC transporter permease subunit [Planctomycetota bacterium]
MHNIATIARNSAREILKQRSFLVVLALGIVAIFMGRYLTLFGLGMEVEMFKDIGTTTILFFGLLMVVFASSSTIYDEIENKTMLTILSRPVTKGEVLTGKFFGIVVTVTIAFAVLLAAFLLTHWWFLNFEYSHSIKEQPFFHPQIIKGVVLAYMQVLVLGGVSVIMSIFVGLLPNISVCGVVFVIGHLTDYIFSEFRDVVTNEINPVANFFYVLIPNLEHYNVSNALMTGIEIPTSYVLLAGTYTVAYITVLLIIGNILFNRREVL